MIVDKNIEFAQWLLTRPNMPLMLTLEMANNSFVMIPFSHLYDLSHDKNTSTWMYAFVNRDEKMYKMTFTSIDELIDTLFNTKEIVYGSEQTSNPLFGCSREEMLIQFDLTRKTN